MNLKISPKKIIIYILISAGAIFMVLPFYWMVSTSLKPLEDTLLFPPKWIPYPPKWDNYSQAWSLVPFGKAYLNSIKISLLVVGGTIFSSSLAAYAFARLEFPGRDLLFFLTIAAMIIPQEATLIPRFILFKNIGWLDTHWSLIVPPALINPLGIFLLRQFIKNIPVDFEEAAYLDGCSVWGIYIHIILPLIRPALITVGILSFLGIWNAFLEPLVFLNSVENFTVTALVNFFNAQATMGATKWNLLMAASSIAVIPTIVVFGIAQKQITEAITLTGLKQ